MVNLDKTAVLDTITAEPTLATELLVDLRERAKASNIFLSRSEQNRLVTLSLKVRAGIVKETR